MAETKAEILARIDEVRRMELHDQDLHGGSISFAQEAEGRISELRALLETAEEDIFRSVIRSHEAICSVKKMHPRAAYGQDPALYYSLAVCGEAGEMGNKIVKALRNGNDAEATRRAVISELPDVVIYSAVLAHVLELDLAKLVNEKVEVVIRRAEDGHYGGIIGAGATSSDLIRAYRDGIMTRSEVVSALAAMDAEEEELRAEAAELRRKMTAGDTFEVGSPLGEKT